MHTAKKASPFLSLLSLLCALCTCTDSGPELWSNSSRSFSRSGTSSRASLAEAEERRGLGARREGLRPLSRVNWPGEVQHGAIRRTRQTLKKQPREALYPQTATDREF